MRSLISVGDNGVLSIVRESRVVGYATFLARADPSRMVEKQQTKTSSSIEARLCRRPAAATLANQRFINSKVGFSRIRPNSISFSIEPRTHTIRTRRAHGFVQQISYLCPLHNLWLLISGPAPPIHSCNESTARDLRQRRRQSPHPHARADRPH